MSAVSVSFAVLLLAALYAIANGREIFEADGIASLNHVEGELVFSHLVSSIHPFIHIFFLI